MRIDIEDNPVGPTSKPNVENGCYGRMMFGKDMAMPSATIAHTSTMRHIVRDDASVLSAISGHTAGAAAALLLPSRR